MPVATYDETVSAANEILADIADYNMAKMRSLYQGLDTGEHDEFVSEFVRKIERILCKRAHSQIRLDIKDFFNQR